VITIEIDDTNTVGWTILGMNVMNDRLLIVLEAITKDEPVRATVRRNSEINIAEEVWTTFGF